MKKLTFGVYFSDEEGNICCKRMTGDWNVYCKSDIKEEPSNYFRDEIANILVENIKLSLTPKVVKDMLSEIKRKEE
jgi:hypothetical protein